MDNKASLNPSFSAIALKNRDQCKILEFCEILHFIKQPCIGVYHNVQLHGLHSDILSLQDKVLRLYCIHFMYVTKCKPYPVKMLYLLKYRSY